MPAIICLAEGQSIAGMAHSYKYVHLRLLCL